MIRRRSQGLRLDRCRTCHCHCSHTAGPVLAAELCRSLLHCKYPSPSCYHPGRGCLRCCSRSHQPSLCSFHGQLVALELEVMEEVVVLFVVAVVEDVPEALISVNIMSREPFCKKSCMLHHPPTPRATAARHHFCLRGFACRGGG